jgi:glycosyltransferase involved in cell wall biosynthesis
MKTLLVTAYDIDPYKGSESGTGWNFVYQLSKYKKLIVITRKNNRNNIEKFIQEYNLNTENMNFQYFDFPKWLMFWKKGNRGSFIYYNLWQIGIPIFVLKRKFLFDATQHLNFHTDNNPSYLWVFQKPFIWGPINHNELIPYQFLDSKKSYIVDRFKFLVKWIRWNLDPLLILCKHRARIIIGSSVVVKNRLRVADSKFRTLSTVASSIPLSNKIMKNYDKEFNVISVGRLVSIKLFEFSLHAYNDFYLSLSDEEKKYTNFKIIGSGPLEVKLKKLAKKLESRDSIFFIGWVDQHELYNLYKSSSVMLVPSQESAGAVVAEGLSHGLPIICFNRYGAGEIIDDSCGIKIDIGSFSMSCKQFGLAIKKIYKDRELYNSLSIGAKSKFKNDLTWESKGKNLNSIHNEIL